MFNILKKINSCINQASCFARDFCARYGFRGKFQHQHIGVGAKSTFNMILSLVLFIIIALSFITIVWAVPPNPGHDFTAISGGVAQGDILYGSATDTLLALVKNTNATRYLSNTGASNNPAWAQVDLTNGVTGILPAGNGGSQWTTSGSDIYYTTGLVGIGTTTPVSIIHALSSTAPQFRLGYDTSNYSNFSINSSGDLTIAPSGGDTSVTGTLTTSGNLTVAGSAGNSVNVSNTLPILNLTDTTTNDEDFMIILDAGIAEIREAAGAVGSFIRLDLERLRATFGKANNNPSDYNTYMYNFATDHPSTDPDRFMRIGSISRTAARAEKQVLYIDSTINGANVTTEERGIQIYSGADGAGTVNRAVALDLWNEALNASSTVTTMEAIRLDFFRNAGAGSANTSNTFGIRMGRDTASRTRKYGLYYGSDAEGSEPTGSFAIYANTDNSYFGANVGIGDTTPASALTIGSGDLFQVNSSGNIVKINNITYSWPSTQGATSTVLSNNGSGTLTWETPSGVMTYLGGTTLGADAATISITLSAAKEHMNCYLEDKGLSAAVFRSVQFNGDASGVYDVNQLFLVVATVNDVQLADQTMLRLDASAADAEVGSCELKITNFSDSNKSVIINCAIADTATAGQSNWTSGAGIWKNTAAQITSVTFLLSGAGNYLAGSHAWCEGRNI